MDWNQGDLFVFPMSPDGQAASHKAGNGGAALYFVRPLTSCLGLLPAAGWDLNSDSQLGWTTWNCS